MEEVYTRVKDTSIYYRYVRKYSRDTWGCYNPRGTYLYKVKEYGGHGEELITKEEWEQALLLMELSR